MMRPCMSCGTPTPRASHRHPGLCDVCDQRIKRTQAVLDIDLPPHIEGAVSYVLSRAFGLVVVFAVVYLALRSLAG